MRSRTLAAVLLAAVAAVGGASYAFVRSQDPGAGPRVRTNPSLPGDGSGRPTSTAPPGDGRAVVTAGDTWDLVMARTDERGACLQVRLSGDLGFDETNCAASEAEFSASGHSFATAARPFAATSPTPPPPSWIVYGFVPGEAVEVRFELDGQPGELVGVGPAKAVAAGGLRVFAVVIPPPAQSVDRVVAVDGSGRVLLDERLEKGWESNPQGS